MKDRVSGPGRWIARSVRLRSRPRSSSTIATMARPSIAGGVTAKRRQAGATGDGSRGGSSASCRGASACDSGRASTARGASSGAAGWSTGAAATRCAGSRTGARPIAITTMMSPTATTNATATPRRSQRDRARHRTPKADAIRFIADDFLDDRLPATLGAHGQLVDDRAVRPLVAVATLDQVIEGRAHRLQLLQLALDLAEMGGRQRADIGAGALPVLPQGDQVADFLDREAEFARALDEAQRREIAFPVN